MPDPFTALCQAKSDTDKCVKSTLRKLTDNALKNVSGVRKIGKEIDSTASTASRQMEEMRRCFGCWGVVELGCLGVSVFGESGCWGVGVLGTSGVGELECFSVGELGCWEKVDVRADE